MARQQKQAKAHRNGAGQRPRGIELVRLRAVQDTLRVLSRSHTGTNEFEDEHWDGEHFEPGALRILARLLRLPYLPLFCAAHETVTGDVDFIPADLQALEDWCAVEEVSRRAVLGKEA